MVDEQPLLAHLRDKPATELEAPRKAVAARSPLRATGCELKKPPWRHKKRNKKNNIGLPNTVIFVYNLQLT